MSAPVGFRARPRWWRAGRDTTPGTETVLTGRLSQPGRRGLPAIGVLGGLRRGPGLGRCPVRIHRFDAIAGASAQWCGHRIRARERGFGEPMTSTGQTMTSSDMLLRCGGGAVCALQSQQRVGGDDTDDCVVEAVMGGYQLVSAQQHHSVHLEREHRRSADREQCGRYQ